MGDQKPIYPLEGWADSGLLVSIPLGERQIGGRPEDPLPAAWLNLIGAYAAMVDRFTVDLSGPNDIALRTPAVIMREQGGAASRGSLLAVPTGVRLGVGSLATEWIEIAARAEAAQAGGEAFSIDGVTYGYGAGGSTCRYVLSPWEASLVGPIQVDNIGLSGLIALDGGGASWRVLAGPDRGNGSVPGSRTVAGFYTLGSTISVPVDVVTSDMDVRIQLLRTTAAGVTSLVAQSVVTYAVGTHTATLVVPALDRPLDVTDGAAYVIVVSVADDTVAGSVVIKCCTFEMVKRGVE
jgi:hypothetical protein